MEIKSNTPPDYESMGVIKEEALVLKALEGRLGIPFFRDPFYRFVNNVEFNNFAVNGTGHVIGLRLTSYEDSHGPLGCFAEEIFSLTSLKFLDILEQNISHIPAKIKELTNLKEYEFLANPLEEIPPEIMELNKLETFRLTLNDEIRDINILPILKSIKIKRILVMEKLRRVVQEYSGKERNTTY